MTPLPVLLPRRPLQIQRILVAIGMFAGIIALLPIAGAIVAGMFGGPARTQTAFASAPPGNYVVYSSAGETRDTIHVAAASDPATAVFVAEVNHLPGYIARGAVSPDGSRLALVVADAGVLAQPVASLVVVDLETGAETRLASGLDYLQDPIWAPAGDGVIAVRAGESAVSLVSVAVNGSGEQLIGSWQAAGLYPVAFDPQGRLVAVVIDGRGSTIVRDGEEVGLLTPSITRDWALSPDGTRIAFVETDLTSGVNYLPRVHAIDGGGVAAMAAQSNVQGLGAAWSPTTADVSFGIEPTSPAAGLALAADAGFDIPLQYAADGSALAVTHWTGASFDSPGDASLQIVTPAGRADIAGASRFFGWSAR